jgi:hypothetical protein
MKVITYGRKVKTNFMSVCRKPQEFVGLMPLSFRSVTKLNVHRGNNPAEVTRSNNQIDV